jgi:hypothetical protein
MHSRELVILRFSYKSHYAYEVARRYLRGRRINIVTFDGAQEVLERMRRHFDRRSVYVHDYDRLLWRCVGKESRWGEATVYLEGKRVHIRAAELPGLQSKLRKAGKLGDWDLIPVMKRLNELCLRRREQQQERLERLTRSFKSLLRLPIDQRPQRAAMLLSERI